MKRKALVVVLVLGLIGLIIFGMYLTDRIMMKNNKPVIFSTWGYSYVPPIELYEDEIQSAIINYIIDKGDNEYKHHENEKTFASMRVYLLEEKERDVIYNVYAWVLQEKYYLEKDVVKQDSGSSIPYKFVVENINGKFVVTDSRMPRDGSYYVDDMKSIFPSSVRYDIDRVHKDGTIERLQLDIQQQKELYFYK